MTIVPGIAEKPPANMMPGTLSFDFSRPSALCANSRDLGAANGACRVRAHAPGRDVFADVEAPEIHREDRRDADKRRNNAAVQTPWPVLCNRLARTVQHARVLIARLEAHFDGVKRMADEHERHAAEAAGEERLQSLEAARLRGDGVFTHFQKKMPRGQ
jgi:hypothetical protein